MMSQTDGIYRSNLVPAEPTLVYGFSTRGFGDARKPENAAKILRHLGVTMPLYKAEQIHGAHVNWVTGNSPMVSAGADAVATASRGILLEVHVADCVPVLLFDPKHATIAAVHAGWKGTVASIVKHTVRLMMDHGATAESLYALIGPHIGMCCYTVQKDRADMFLNAFHGDSRVASYWENAWHLDLGYANRLELLEIGVPAEHIDAPIMCTSCQIDSFYSYRKDTKETFGEIIGVIGLK